MALSLTELEAYRDELLRMRLSGVLKSRIQDRETTFEDGAALDAAIARADAEIAKLNTSGGKHGTVLSQFSRG